MVMMAKRVSVTHDTSLTVTTIPPQTHAKKKKFQQTDMGLRNPPDSDSDSSDSDSASCKASRGTKKSPCWSSNDCGRGEFSSSAYSDNSHDKNDTNVRGVDSLEKTVTNDNGSNRLEQLPEYFRTATMDEAKVIIKNQRRASLKIKRRISKKSQQL